MFVRVCLCGACVYVRMCVCVYVVRVRVFCGIVRFVICFSFGGGIL